MKPKFDINGLSPAIAQDAHTGKVLMMAWMNEDAWRETLDSGNAVYFSRSRNKLWRKGEESGHVQKVIDARLDCDEDTILLQVEQIGPACHEGYQTCFFRKVLPSGDVEICEQRLKLPSEIYANPKSENK